MKPTWTSANSLRKSELEVEQIVLAKNNHQNNHIQNNDNENNESNDNNQTNNNNNNNEYSNNNIRSSPNQNQIENENEKKILEEKKESKKNITITIPESKSELNLPHQGHTKFNTKISEPREKPNRRYSLPAGIFIQFYFF